jgi:serine/threonine protein kinase
MGPFLGEGGFGRVFKPHDGTGDDSVAVKQYKRAVRDDAVSRDVVKETCALMLLRNCRNIVRIFHTNVSELHNGCIELHMERMEYDLHAFSRHMGPLSFTTVREIMTGLANGVSYMHERGIIHRDLKPSNCLVNESGTQVKVADFGTARFTCISRCMTLDGFTLLYRPPEILFGSKDYCRKVDVWGMGCIHVELRYGKHLFESGTEVDLMVNLFRRLGSPCESSFPFQRFPQFPHWLPRFVAMPLASWFGTGSSVHISEQEERIVHYLMSVDPMERMSADMVYSIYAGTGVSTPSTTIHCASRTRDDELTQKRERDTDGKVEIDWNARVSIEQTVITLHMRSILIDWLLEISIAFELELETYFLTVSYVDELLHTFEVTKQNLQLYGVVCLTHVCHLVDSTYIDFPSAVHICNDTYSTREIMDASGVLLGIALNPLESFMPLAKDSQSSSCSYSKEVLFATLHAVHDRRSLRDTYGVAKRIRDEDAAGAATGLLVTLRNNSDKFPGFAKIRKGDG